MANRTLADMKAAHRVLAEFSFEPKELNRGYADRWLRVDIGSNEIEVRPVSQEMKDLWVGGKGFDLWLTFQEVNGDTRWDSPENPICFSSGPLGGTTSYPGSGKTLVTAVSPLTDSMIDCNVGGYFGPYLKFAGFDAMMVTGKAREEVLVFIDAVNGKVTIEAAPEESVDSHVVAEELTEMYAADRLDMRNVAVVSAGRGAEHTRMGVLNFSFYDWRRRVPRLKQAGRGGVGTVFRDKKLKALVLKNAGITPAWRVSESKVSTAASISVCDDCGTDVAMVREIVARYEANPNRLLDILQDVQDLSGYLTRASLEEITELTGQTMGVLYELVTFYESLTFDQAGVAGRRVRDEVASLALRQLFAPGEDKVFAPGDIHSYLAPGAAGLLAELFEQVPVAEVTRTQVAEALGAQVSGRAGDGTEHCRVEVLAREMAADATQACGACTPCREGLPAMAATLSKISGGEARTDDLAFLEAVATTVSECSLCAFGKHASIPILKSLESCRDDFVAHLTNQEVN